MIALDLQGKTALITGGSQGLGEAIARRLAEAGASVVVNYFPDTAGKNRERAQAVAESLGTGSRIVPGDVASAASMQELTEEVGAVDFVVNNAGIARDRSLLKMSDAEWNAVIKTNLNGVFHVCRACLPQMREGGAVVNVSSVSAFTGLFGQTNYAAAKAGVGGLTRALSREVARRGVRVNAVAPGLVLTDLGQTVPEEVRDRWLQEIPMHRFGEAREIADAVLFLCSPLASYITGQTLHVNGGWYF